MSNDPPNLSNANPQSWINNLPADPDMSKRSLWTHCAPLPTGVSRESAVEVLHDHITMIELNPTSVRFERARPPPNCSADEYHAIWYEVTDRLTSTLPSFGIGKSEVTFKCCFHDLSNGLQTHVYAPAGLDIRTKWSVGGNMPGEPREKQELGLQQIGAPREGLYVREDVDMRCNVFLMNYTKRNMKKKHTAVMQRLIAKADLVEGRKEGERSLHGVSSQYSSHPTSSSPPPSYAGSPHPSNGSPTIFCHPVYGYSSYLKPLPPPPPCICDATNGDVCFLHPFGQGWEGLPPPPPPVIYSPSSSSVYSPGGLSQSPYPSSPPPIDPRTWGYDQWQAQLLNPEFQQLQQPGYVQTWAESPMARQSGARLQQEQQYQHKSIDGIIELPPDQAPIMELAGTTVPEK